MKFETDSLVSLAKQLRAGELGVVDYLETLARRSAVEPQVLSLMVEPARFERVREEAALLEARFPVPAERPPLYGVPIGVKDIFRVDQLPTTAGSRLPPGEFEGLEAQSVTELKRAGVLVLAKTVSTEFAYFGPGRTRNPHDPGRTPGGSSSGSAAAVAAGLVPLSLGTQTIGSISRPAAYCGVVGYKPSYDRISREGVIPLSPSLDHIGLFTTDVAGAELGASQLCADWAPKLVSGNPVLGIPKGPILKRASSEALHHLKSVSDRLKERGFEVRVVPAMPEFDEIERRHRAIVAAEAAAVHSSWYADWGALYHPRTVALLAAGREVSESDLKAALAGRRQLREELTELMADRGVDVWISPAATDVAPEGLDSTGDPVMSLPWSYCGLPTLAIPAGVNGGGLPLGLQLAASWMEDERLFGWGKRIEGALA